MYPENSKFRALTVSWLFDSLTYRYCDQETQENFRLSLGHTWPGHDTRDRPHLVQNQGEMTPLCNPPFQITRTVNKAVIYPVECVP